MYTANLPTRIWSSVRQARCASPTSSSGKIAYAEIFVTDRLWPDFRGIHLLEAITDFQRREPPLRGIGQAVTDELLPEELPELLRH